MSYLWHCMVTWVEWWIGGFSWMLAICFSLGAMYTAGSVLHKLWGYVRKPRGSSH